MSSFIHKVTDQFLQFQKRHALIIVLVGLVAAGFCLPRAARLLGKVATELENLLPTEYSSVSLNKEIKKNFNRRSSLSLIISSPTREHNQAAALAIKEYLLKQPEVDFIENEKTGYDFFDRNKLMLVSLDQLYRVRDKLKDRIQKEKLGGLYIDFESDDSGKGDDVWEELKAKYKSLDTGNIQNRYLTNADGTVYVLKIYPKSTDTGLKFFTKFGKMIEDKVNEFNPKQFGDDVEWGYAGAIRTRVDEYQALMDDLQLAGTISGILIFVVLFLYFRRVVAALIVFVPMLISTSIAFWFNSFFFDHLNVVTSFLFSIIFGLGVDIGIHMLSRYIQDRSAGMSVDHVHRKIITKTGQSAALGVATTVASFYVLVINDFKGFSDFGWIAGNGLLIALFCYLFFFPPFILVAERFKLLRFKHVDYDPETHSYTKRRNIPYATAVLTVCLLLAVASIISIRHVGFEWNFNNLKIKIPERVALKEKLKSTSGRVNSPAAYMVENAVEARALRRVIDERKNRDTNFPTIDEYRSYYDIMPLEAEEKISVIHEIENLLNDDALNSLKPDEKKLVDEFRVAAKNAHVIKESEIPKEVHEMFWGNTGNTKNSLAFVAPLPQLELDNGYNAEAFYNDVHEVRTLGKLFYALSDSIIFAEVLKTLFHDSEVAIVLSSLILIGLIWFDFKDMKRTGFIVLGLGCGIVWMFGIMDLIDFKLNFYNMIVIPTMIGMGEDNSVHIVNRFEEMGRKSILAAMRSSGFAAFMASLTTILGYSGLCFAHHPGLNSIGWMAIIGLGTCLAGSLVVLPLLMQLFLKPESAKH